MKPRGGEQLAPSNSTTIKGSRHLKSPKKTGPTQRRPVPSSSHSPSKRNQIRETSTETICLQPYPNSLSQAPSTSYPDTIQARIDLSLQSSIGRLVSHVLSWAMVPTSTIKAYWRGESHLLPLRHQQGPAMTSPPQRERQEQLSVA